MSPSTLRLRHLAEKLLVVLCQCLFFDFGPHHRMIQHGLVKIHDFMFMRSKHLAFLKDMGLRVSTPP